jgi:CMP-N-acetylneuraminic acid synthetase
VTSEVIDAAIAQAHELNSDTVITVKAAEHFHPSLLYRVGKDQQATHFFNDEVQALRRQDQEEVWIRTGLVYVVKAEQILSEGKIYGKKISAIKVPEELSLVIDTESDLELADVKLKKLTKEFRE